VDKGVNIDVTDYQGRTPLMAAVINENPAIAASLIRLGANLDASASDGTTALMLAAQSHRARALSLLIAAGADVNARMLTGKPHCSGPPGMEPLKSYWCCWMPALTRR
jgi:ankyrin repeat protein